MKYKLSRKLNLSIIDKELYPYEMEELGVDGADSPEEASQAIEKFVAERKGYHKAMSETEKAKKIAPVINTSSANQTAPIEIKPPIFTNADGVSNNPPEEFNI